MAFSESKGPGSALTIPPTPRPGRVRARRCWAPAWAFLLLSAPAQAQSPEYLDVMLGAWTKAHAGLNLECGKGDHEAFLNRVRLRFASALPPYTEGEVRDEVLRRAGICRSGSPEAAPAPPGPAAPGGAAAGSAASGSAPGRDAVGPGRSLMLAAITNYRTRTPYAGGEQDLPHLTTAAHETAKFWRGTGSPEGVPTASVFTDDEVHAGLFLGPEAECTRHDWVVVSGHASPLGPWLGFNADAERMDPTRFHWAEGRTKWVTLSGCLNLYDNRVSGPWDPVELLRPGRWQRAMGLDAPGKRRLHALFGNRAFSYVLNLPERTTLPGGRRGAATPYRRLPYIWTWPHFAQVRFASCGEKALASSGLPTSLGELWMHFNARFISAYPHVPGVAPGVLTWRAARTSDPATIVYDYFQEGLERPFPNPGQLGPEFTVEPVCHFETYGTPVFR